MSSSSPYAIAEDKSPLWKSGEELAAAAFVGIAISLIFDVNVGIWRVFRKPQGLYYWSMKLGTIACLLDAIGVILKYLVPNPYQIWGLYTACLLVGWSIYAPAQLLVLYSRLHLVNSDHKTQRWVLFMILSTILFLVIPTWVVVWPAYDPDPKISSLWSPRDAIVERYNQIGFTLVEITLSGIYIWSLLGLLNLKASVRQRRVMLDIIYVNVIIVSLDIIVVVLVYLNQTGISHPMQTFSYALKLKLEFVVLNQLMAVAARGVQRANFEERRYHHSSATDPFSAECREWDKKTSDLPKEEGKGPRQENHELSHSGSLQITLPSPTVSKHDRRQSNMAGHDEAASPRPKRDADNSLRDKSRNRTYDQERIEENVFEMDENLQPDSFLDVDDNDTDAIRHKPSEAFSGDTLRSPAPRTASPPSYTRRLKEAKDQVLRPTRSPSSRRGHDRLVTGNERKPPHKARFRKSIPKNARFVHEEDEEEEIGVHMWENNRGSLVLEVPWFRSKVEG